MSQPRVEALETAIRRSLGFHLGSGGAAADEEQQQQDRELLVSALIDAAESGTLRDTAAVAREFDDYLPHASLAGDSDRQELFDDILR